jgi:hypothetical protein
MMRQISILALALVVGGCSARSQAPQQPTTAGLAAPAQDARSGVEVLVHLLVYQINVPLGTVSNSEEFWKHVDEQCLNVATHSLLLKNGVRAGVAAAREWDYFKNILDRSAAQTSSCGFQGGGSGTGDLALKTEVAEQTLFFFNQRNLLEGRSFERSDNLLCTEFRANPRKIGEVWLRVCPMVRTLRKRFVFDEEDERRLLYRSPEKVYDLALDVSVPPGSFLVLAPSTEARWKVSLGYHFLVHDTAAGLNEQLILLVPRVYPLATTRKADAR